MKISTFFFPFLLILFLAFSCDGKEEPARVKKDMTLSETELLFEKQDDLSKTITVKTNEPFHLDKQPDWLILEADQNEKTIKISDNLNYSKQSREVLLKVWL